MVQVRVGDEHMGDGLASKPVEECLDVRVERRSRVDDRDAFMPHHVGAGAVEGERARIDGATVRSTPYSNSSVRLNRMCTGIGSFLEARKAEES